MENIIFLLDVAEMKCTEMFVDTGYTRTVQALNEIFKKGNMELCIEVIDAIKKVVEEWQKKN